MSTSFNTVLSKKNKATDWMFRVDHTHARHRGEFNEYMEGNFQPNIIYWQALSQEPVRATIDHTDGLTRSDFDIATRVRLHGGH